MMDFREFLLETADQADIKRTLAKLPKSHQKLVSDYKISFQPGNTLKNDKEHIGYIDNAKKTIVIAAPYNYGREFTLLHEIGHRIWEKLVTHKMRIKWHEIVSKTKNKQKQNDEEMFAMSYANFYAKNKITIHNHEAWNDFIKKLPS